MKNKEMIEYHQGILDTANQTLKRCELNGKEDSLLYKYAKHHKRVAENCLAKL